jgi:hypothetical protein
MSWHVAGLLMARHQQAPWQHGSMVQQSRPRLNTFFSDSLVALLQVWTRDVLNLGVSPAKLIDLMRAKLAAAGGVLLERTGVSGGRCNCAAAACAWLSA